MHKKSFESYLREQNLSENTIKSYLWTIRSFKVQFKLVNARNLAAYKELLLQSYKPKTVNLRLTGIAKYLDFIGKKRLMPQLVKVQQKMFLENVISNEDYEALKRSLKADGQLKWYFTVWYLGATGMRISELVRLRVEHVQSGYADIYSKGGKQRRVYIPKDLQEKSLEWISSQGRDSGPVFLNKFGAAISPRGIAYELKQFARRYGLNETVVYPHSFRHRFAKNFLEKSNDITFLADMLGHENLETTRIYLRRSSSEQRDFFDSVVTW